MELVWPLPKQKSYPLSISFEPYMIDHSPIFVNPFLGYPSCPIIGRYNRGQYKIGETLLQINFKCKFNQDIQQYQCDNKVIDLPEKILYNLRNIPQVMPINKVGTPKTCPDFIPQKFQVRDDLSIIWIVSFGQMGKDFLNYLNHMYILANTMFLQEKLKKNVHYLPIYAHLPERSGFQHKEVERGLNFENYRGQYMSFHLSRGAPAFSPNNMRLAIEGGKIITSKPQNNQKKKKKQSKFVEKKQKAKNQPQSQQQLQTFLQQLNKALQPEQSKPSIEAKITESNQTSQPIPIVQVQKQQKSLTHQGFVHFYSSMLLQQDYRVYYHWHIEDKQKQHLIKQIWADCRFLQEFVSKYLTFLGQDPLVSQLSRLLYSFK